MENTKEAAPEVSAHKQQSKICPKCGQIVSGNFCSYCGKKIDKTCEKCWLRHEQSYNCGYEECPGYRLLTLDKSKS